MGESPSGSLCRRREFRRRKTIRDDDEKKIKICDKNKNIVLLCSFFLLPPTNIDSFVRGVAKHRGSILASCPEAPGSILGVPKNFTQDLLMALLRTVDKGLIMSIEAI